MTARAAAAEPATCELIVTHAAWETALRQLLLDPRCIAVGTIRWNETRQQSEWLVDRLDVVSAPPRGADRFPLTGWAVLTIVRGTAESVLEAVAPRASQTVVIVRFDPDDHERWEGIVHHEAECRPLDGLRVIGPRMLHLQRRPGAAADPPADGRWSRTAGALGPRLWRQVRRAHVLLVGCGRNGTLAAWQLAGLGVAQLTLVDPDKLEPANLDAMPGLTTGDVGRPKAIALARRLVAFNPDLLVRCFHDPVTDVLDQLRFRFDLIVSCVDQDAPRLAASWLSRELLAPHLDIGTTVQRTGEEQFVQSGDVRLLLPFAGCVECVGGIAEPDDTFYEFAAPPGSLHRGTPQAWWQQRAGSLVHLNSVAVGTAVELWLSLLSGETGSFWQRLAWEPGSGLDAEGAVVDTDEHCPRCRPG